MRVMGGRSEDLDALIEAIAAGSPAVEQAAERLHAAPWGQLGAPGDRQKVDEWLRAVMDVSRIVGDRATSCAQRQHRDSRPA